ncbi:MAG TPA: hypothetical protein VF447_06645, partial [Terriglobales bacterium]
MLRPLITCLGLAAASSAWAGGTASNAHVTAVDVRVDGYFLVSFDVPNPAPAPCATSSSVRLTADANTAGGKALLGIALASKSIGSPVAVEGKGTCDQYSGYESI